MCLYYLVDGVTQKLTRMHAAAFAAQMNMPMPLRRCRRRHSVCRSRGAADSQLSPPKNNHPGGWLFFCVEPPTWNRPECTPQPSRRRRTCLCPRGAVGADILYAAPAERRIHSCLHQKTTTRRVAFLRGGAYAPHEMRQRLIHRWRGPPSPPPGKAKNAASVPHYPRLLLTGELAR